MTQIRLSSKGQIVIPKAIRDRHHWREGQELEIFDSEDGLILKEKRPFKQTSLDDVAGSLTYKGKAKTLEEMEAAIEEGAKKSAGSNDRG